MQTTPSPVNDFTARATVGLEADPELRREVEAELASHIEASLDEGAAGGSVDETIRRLGEVEDLAGKLLEGNLRRLRTRARLRVLVAFALVPAAVLSALWLGPWRATLASRRQSAFFQILGSDSSANGLRGLMLSALSPPSRRRLSEEQRLIVYGGAGATGAAREKAILDRFPGNPTYRGNYISSLIAEGRDDLERLGPVLEEAMLAEPDNARYNLILAAARLRRAATLEADGDHPDRLVITDREGLDAAMDELARGLAKPSFRRYGREMLAERMAILGPPSSLSESIERTAVAAGLLMPDLGDMRRLGRAANSYAQLLAEEGDAEAARRFAEAWQGLARHLLNDSFTLIDTLVASALIGLGEQAAGVYDSLGEPDEAAACRQTVATWNAPVQNWKAGQKENTGGLGETVRAKGSFMDALLIPALGETVSEAELRGGRLLDYCLVDRSAVLLLLTLATGVLLGCWAIGLRWRLTAGGGYQAIILVPRLGEYARILGWGLVLPAAGYTAAVLLPAVGGREWSVNLNLWRSLALLSSASVTCLLLTSHLARRAARRRCEILRIAVPERGGLRRWIDRGTVALMAVAVAAAMVPPPGQGGVSWKVLPAVSLAATALGVLVRSGVSLCRLPQWLGSRKHGTYFGTLARSVVPVYAAFILVLGWFALPVLRQAEQRLVVQSSWGRPDIEGFTIFEDRLTRRLVAELKAAAPPP
ncbi:MAG: hypothetical protein BWZ02_02590 [Lentisphaerae bacterium ADurb.BinA184]|nr:MAG: hypothetical protein BWZ02_02590 [Lentisphaerae bacterium ADurb.BinA184]